MKLFGRIFAIVVVLSFVAACGGKTVNPEAEQWAKDNGLGPYQPEVDDWAAIEAAAIQEGEVVVYSNSGGVEDLPDAWYALYPDIEFNAADTEGIDTKMLAEQESGNVVGDVWFNSDGHILYGQFVPNKYMWWFVPRDVNIPELTEDYPFAIARHSVDLWGYNSEVYPDGCPITNVWQLTEAKYYGKIFMKDPITDVSSMAKMATYVQHAEELATAYQTLYGKPWTEDEKASPDTSGLEVTNAGYLFLKKLAQNGVVALDDGDEVDLAYADPDLLLDPGEEPGFGFSGYSSYEDTMDGELVMAPCFGLEPAVGVFKTTFMGIANNAPHPNAAKLFIKFILSAEGIDPWVEIGTYPAAEGLPVSEDNLPLEELLPQVWEMDPIFDWENMGNVRNFWTAEVLVTP